MSETYSRISLSHMDAYLALLGAGKAHASDYSFANIWGWAPYYSLEWRFDDTLCWIRQKRSSEIVNWAPVGPWESVTNWPAMPEMTPGATFIRVPERLALLWQDQFGDRVTIEETRGQWDYLYAAQDLIDLSGNKFHKKKNLLNQFTKLYEYKYCSMTEECVDTVLNMQVEWCRWRDCEASEALLAENDAVARVLSCWGEIPGLFGGIIRVDDVPVAYTIGEELSDDMIVIHFEKAATGIKGGYQAINWLFANDACAKYTYINREQDLDDEGLRKAKLSYHPVSFLKKYTVTIR